MLRKNLLYTGITRAKNFIILCGESDTFIYGFQRTDDLQRHTSLSDRLNNDQPEVETTKVGEENSDEISSKSEEEQLMRETSVEVNDGKPAILTVDNVNFIHPMIGMKGISPYDFMVNEN